MSTQQALAFFRRHQPFPRDLEFTEELIAEFDAARQTLAESRVVESIPLLLNCFGEGDGLGRYQLMEDLLRKFDMVEVLPHLIRALESEDRNVQYWCAQLAENFPSIALIEPLEKLVAQGNEDISTAASTALEQIIGRR
jgi:hypothetical protein